MRCWHSKIIDKPPNQFKHAVTIASPASGELMSLTATRNPISALRLLGEGVALKLTGQQVCSPVNGTVIEFVPTCQKIRIKAHNGLDINISFIDDISRLMSERFVSQVRLGDTVGQGDTLFNFDLNLLKQQQIETVLSITIKNASRAIGILPNQYGRKVLASIDSVMTLYV